MSRRAHPRGCGEHSSCAVALAEQMGSSPRVRGTCYTPLASTVGAGLIPAGAGNIATVEQLNAAVRAHPRGCGEHF